MARIKIFSVSSLVALVTVVSSRGADLPELKTAFQSPPPEVRLHAYWWWLNGNVTAEAITWDLEAMKEKDFGGSLITDAGGAEQDGNRQVPKGPLFGSQPWRELYRHALREAKRLDFELVLNIQSGWNLGGPSVTPEDAANQSAGLKKNFPEPKSLFEITGPWNIAFDPAWFYPDDGSGGRVVFEKLVDWTQLPNEAIQHFSGAAFYRTVFDLPAGLSDRRESVQLSLGAVREMARVTLNGRPLGIAWCPPWQVSVPDGLLMSKGNRLEIEVVNFWPNRLIGDAQLPPAQRRTRTNITKFENPKGDKHYTTLMPSGLLGPVQIVTMD